MLTTKCKTICGTERDWRDVPKDDTLCSGVFPDRVNKVSFIDKLTVGVNGDPRKRIDPAFEITANPAIGGPGRPYARSKRGIYKVTGNPFELRYGKNRTYRHLTDAKVILRSEGTPMSCAEGMEILTRLFRKGQRHIVRGIEFTFDVSIPFQFFETHILTRAHSVRTLTDSRNRQTLYAGTPRGEWMLRIYEKTTKTTRVEFVLRHSLLTKARVTRLENLGNLKNLDLNRMVRFPVICQRAFQDLIRGKFTGKQLDTLRHWPGHWFSRTLLEVLDHFELEGDRILRVSPEDELLRKMQERFKW